MYWAEFYAALTLVVLCLAVARQNHVAIAAAGLLLAEWVVKNSLHDFGAFGSLSNTLSSAILLLIGYGFWYKMKAKVLAFMVFVSIAGVLLHGIHATLHLESYLHAMIANGFYLVKTLAVLAVCIDIESRDAQE